MPEQCLLPANLAVEDDGGEDAAEGILHHILVGVPFIALGAEDCLARSHIPGLSPPGFIPGPALCSQALLTLTKDLWALSPYIPILPKYC